MVITQNLCRIVLTTLCVFLLPCGGGSSPSPSPFTSLSPSTSPSLNPSPGASPSPSGPALERVSNTECVAPDEAATLGDFELTAVFDEPGFPDLGGIVGLYQEPGNSERWYALLRWGRVVRFDNKQNTTQIETFLEIDDVNSSAENGFFGFAFHPNYQNNGYVYVYYNDENNDNASTISRFTSVSGQPINANTEQVLLTLNRPAVLSHNGGDIHFGPDGYLYIGFGDGGRCK